MSLTKLEESILQCHLLGDGNVQKKGNSYLFLPCFTQ